MRSSKGMMHRKPIKSLNIRLERWVVGVMCFASIK